MSAYGTPYKEIRKMNDTILNVFISREFGKICHLLSLNGKSPACVSMRAVYGFFICWLLFKCKTFEIFLIEFVLLYLFYNCIILFLHIESLYKVG